jgi:hypothetical protein
LLVCATPGRNMKQPPAAASDPVFLPTNASRPGGVSVASPAISSE